MAARDIARARVFARKHGIARVHDSYQTLIDDPALDAVYIPLPNGLHGRWTRAALAAGKHVLCEKPFTANAAEARQVAELAGGATMDAGCYAVHMARTFGGANPEVVSAQAKLHDALIDRAMTAELRFPAGHTGRIRCSLWSARLLQVSAKVIGDDGELHVFNPVLPQLFHRLSVRSAAGRRVERFSRRSSYAFQLDAFADAALRGAPVKTTPADAVENMAVIDAVYRAAGLPVREPS